MIKLHKLIASVLGIGYAKGGGTYASIAFCLIYISLPAGCLTPGLQVFYLALICALGVWSSNAVEPLWGKDSSKVVIDEVAGMMITLISFPNDWKHVLTGLILFRFFDIAKPFFIRRLEKLPKGWGVMADDALAGIYAHILLFFIGNFLR